MTFAIVVIILLGALVALLSFLPFFMRRATRETKIALLLALCLELITLCGLVTVALTFNKEDLPAGISGVGLIALVIIPVAFIVVYWNHFQYHLLLRLYKKVVNKSE